MKPAPIPRLVVIGASAGGIEALRRLTGALPSDFPAPICIVLHLPPQSPAVLDGILGRVAALPVLMARSGQPLEPRHIFVAPPDHHLLVEPGILRLTREPARSHFRPAIDPLFRSAAQVYGPAVIGVVLTGNLDDGTAGLGTIKQLGGQAVVQDPDDAQCPEMPSSALSAVAADHVAPLDRIASLLSALVAGATPATGGTR